MLKAPWNSGTGRFELGGKQMGRMEYLLGAALGIVILGALIMTIIQFGKGGSTGVEAKPVTTYHCDSCQGEFDYVPPENGNNMNDDPMMGPRPIKCEKCGKMDAWLMNRCYKCGQLFPASKEEHRRDFAGGAVCPHCNTNQLEYLKEKLKR